MGYEEIEIKNKEISNLKYQIKQLQAHNIRLINKKQNTTKTNKKEIYTKYRENIRKINTIKKQIQEKKEKKINKINK